MTCEYRDGLRIEYSGSLRVRRGNEIGGYVVREGSLPSDLKNDLDTAVRKWSCEDVRRISDAIVRGAPCGKVCL